MLSQSFDTIESSYVGVDEDFSLLGAGTPSNDAISTTTHDGMDDAGAVTDEDMSGEENPQTTGILIVPPGPPHASLILSTTNEQAFRSPMNFSVPDSVPSNVGTLLFPEQALSTTSTTAPNAACERKQVIQYASAFLLLSACVFSLPTIYLIRERNTLLSMTLRLGEQIRVLEQEVDSGKAQANLRLEELIHGLRNDINAKAIPNIDHTFSREQAGHIPDDINNNSDFGLRRSTTIDNCWLRADANLELGECAIQTRNSFDKKLKKFRKKLGEKLYDAQAEFLVRMEHVKQQYYYTSDLQAGRSTPQEQNKTQDFDYDDAIKRGRERVRTVGKIAAKIFAGVAFASAATLVASGAFFESIVGDSGDDDRS